MIKTLIGVMDESTGIISGYDGEKYTKAELELIEKNVSLNSTYILYDDTPEKKETSYRLVMETVVENTRCFFEFDSVTDVDVTSTSQITEHPLVNGDTITDHMYNMPASMTVTGKFSLQGSKRYPYDGANGRLANIEDIFEKIRREGITSKLMTISGNDESTARFKIRENMALTSITWNEHLNSMDFTFQFNEVLQANVQEVSYDVDVTDPNLPALTDASSLDFTDTLLDWNQVDLIVMKKLISIEAVTSDFLQFACDFAKSMTVGGLTGFGIGVVAGIAVLKTVLIACGSVPVYGWIAAAGIIAVCAIAGSLLAIFKSISRANERNKYKIKQYRLYEDDRKNKQNAIEFSNYIGNIHQNLAYLNDVIQVYGFTNGTQNQECMAYIDDNYYIFRFMKNNTTLHWSLTVLDIEEHVKKSIPDCNAAVLGSLADCNLSNQIFITESGGFYVYLVSKTYEADINNGATQETIEKHHEDLTNYYVVVSQTNMEQFNSLLSDIVLNAMTK